MDLKLKKEFQDKWKQYFGKADLPITFYFADADDKENPVSAIKKQSCLICMLATVRNGGNLVLNANSINCSGAKRYIGYSAKVNEDFKYFLSCGIPGVMEGERYLRTPEMVVTMLKNQQRLPAEGRNIVFKRWDNLTEHDEPDVVIFFSRPDVLSGLFTLANFDQSEPNGTFSPFAAGCGSIIHYPYLEKDAPRPRAVIGIFDPSARNCVPSDVLSFAVPFVRFKKMIETMDESFLITDTWLAVSKRIKKADSNLNLNFSLNRK